MLIRHPDIPPKGMPFRDLPAWSNPFRDMAMQLPCRQLPTLSPAPFSFQE